MLQEELVKEGLYGYYSLTDAGRKKVESAIREQIEKNEEPSIEIELECCSIGAFYDFEDEMIRAELFFLDAFGDDASNLEDWSFKCA